MPRCLVMSERTVSEAERENYLQSLAVRRKHAAAASVHFWVFEDDSTRGRFMEFVEAGSHEALRNAVGILEVHGATSATPQSLSPECTAVIWKEVSGNE